MATLPKDIAALVATEKRIGITPAWDEESDPRYVKFTVPLTFGDVTAGGFDFRVKISKNHIDRDCMAQMEYAPDGRRSAEPLWRIEWRPFCNHTNEAWGPPGFELAVFIGATHSHRFDDNFLPDELRLRSGNLPGARPVEPDPNTVSDFLAFCGKEFRISDIGRIQLPVLTRDMFWISNG